MSFEMNGLQNNVFPLNDGVSQRLIKVKEMMEEIVDRQLGIPKELVASTLAAEIVYDSDFINTIYDVSTSVVGGVADIAFILNDRTTHNELRIDAAWITKV